MSVEISKLLSHVLRHAPERLGITLDASGWTSVDILIANAREQGFAMDRATLEAVVESSDKKRFTLSDDGQMIRAAQGHSVAVDLGLSSAAPPGTLFHGTARDNLDSILAEGLKPGSRQHVHLSLDEETAIRVGSRHGKPIVLKVDTASMLGDGHVFFRADNGVSLTDHVPSNYLTL